MWRKLDIQVMCIKLYMWKELDIKSLTETKYCTGYVHEVRHRSLTKKT
jgi:hypothetical protein